MDSVGIVYNGPRVKISDIFKGTSFFVSLAQITLIKGNTASFYTTSN